MLYPPIMSIYCQMICYRQEKKTIIVVEIVTYLPLVPLLALIKTDFPGRQASFMSDWYIIVYLKLALYSVKLSLYINKVL